MLANILVAFISVVNMILWIMKAVEEDRDGDPFGFLWVPIVMVVFSAAGVVLSILNLLGLLPETIVHWG